MRHVGNASQIGRNTGVCPTCLISEVEKQNFNPTMPHTTALKVEVTTKL